MNRDLGKHAREMRSKVFRHMLESRGWKYRSFLWYLRFFKYISFSPVRGDFLESYYTLMRYLDDIVDGDFPMPGHYSSETEYILDKIIFAEHPHDPKDAADYLMLYCFDLAQKMGTSFVDETHDILASLLFDAERRGRRIIFSEKELQDHYRLLVIRGTIKASLKIFKDDPGKYLLLEPLGIACRYQYDLEDFESDVKAGYINISLEEFEQLGISTDELDDPSSPVFWTWFRYRAAKGLELLAEHHRRLEKGNFSLLEKGTFRLVYEQPARKLFDQILKQGKSNSQGVVNEQEITNT